MDQPIEEGFEVFTSESGKPFGAVRQARPHGRGELVIYIENAGDFTVPIEAVASVHSEKVILNLARLEPRLQQAIRHAHDAEDPNI
jgi:hypothetical protein